MTVVKWIAITAGVLIGLAGLITLVGALLPVRHSASRTIALSQQPDTVWALLRNVAGYPAWWTSIESVARMDGTREAWRLQQRTGPLPLAITEEDPPRRFVTAIVDEGLPFGGTWTYEIEPANGGTHVTVTEDGEVYNPFFRFMARFVFGYAATIESYLEHVAAHYGQPVEYVE